MRSMEETRRATDWCIDRLEETPRMHADLFAIEVDVVIDRYIAEELSNDSTFFRSKLTENLLAECQEMYDE